MAPSSSALTVMTGDFNFVPHYMDRRCVTTGEFSGARDRPEQDDFNAIVDIGVPMDYTLRGAEDVLVIYTSEKALPTTAAANDSKHQQVAATSTKQQQQLAVSGSKRQSADEQTMKQ